MNSIIKMRPMKLFSDFFQGIDHLSEFGDLGSMLEFPVDVQGDANSWIVKAELPGISKENINISLEHGLLTIIAEKKEEISRKNTNQYISERNYGSFTRSLRLPNDVDEKSVSANLTDGVLEIQLKRAETTKQRRIPIS